MPPERSVVPIRSAATVLIVRDDPFEVLMVERHHQAFFASALVFPGGLVDPYDASDDWLPHIHMPRELAPAERALRIAAVRETFEETGLLLTEDPVPDQAGERDRPFLELVRSLGTRLSLREFHKIGHWVTPDISPRRYDTHFYVVRAPAAQQPVCDGRETVSLEWLAPGEAVHMAEAGMREILFPTRMNLKRLAECGGLDAAIAAAVEPPFTVRPTVEQNGDRLKVMIPAEAGYGVTEDWTVMNIPR